MFGHGGVAYNGDSVSRQLSLKRRITPNLDVCMLWSTSRGTTVTEQRAIRLLPINNAISSDD